MGSMFVNTRAREFLKSTGSLITSLLAAMLTATPKEKLIDTRFGNDECIDSMLQGFESSAKPTFRDVAKTSYIKFGSLKDTDDKFGIKRGVLSLAGCVPYRWSKQYLTIAFLLAPKWHISSGHPSTRSRRPYKNSLLSLIQLLATQ